MTTAHRPTWHAAVGQKNEGGWHAGGAFALHQAPSCVWTQGLTIVPLYDDLQAS